MRYVHDHGEFDEETIKAAEALFERYVGRVLAVQLYTEHVPIVEHRGRLSHTPVVRIESVRAFVDNSSYVPWSLEDDIDIHRVIEKDGFIRLPSSLFGESYTSASVTYLAGYDPIPSEVSDTVLEIARLMSDRMVDEWSGMNALSDTARAVIAKYQHGR